jgi:DNA-binding NarL/FixJ family response regulator
LSLRDGFRAAGEIMRRLPCTKIIHHATAAESFSQYDQSESMRSDGRFSQALRLVGTAGRAVTDAGEPSARIVASPPAAPAGLTSREREVLELLARGVAMKVIAHRLGITYRTVAFHKYNMMQRLGIRTNAGLTTYALQAGALKPPGVMGHRVSAAGAA